jgi:hypothetical protein
MLSERPVISRCRLNVQWPVHNPVTSLHCFLSKAIGSLDILSEGLSIKSFDCLIPGVAAECSECLSFSHFLTLILPTHGEENLRYHEPYFQVVIILKMPNTPARLTLCSGAAWTIRQTDERRFI